MQSTRLFALAAAVISIVGMECDPVALGQSAERRACRYLRWRAWRIVARNWRGRNGELDIVASRWRTLLVVEVRRRPTVAEAFASIDRGKLDRTLATACELITRFGLDRYRLRVDLIGVDPTGRLLRRRDLLTAS